MHASRIADTKFIYIFSRMNHQIHLGTGCQFGKNVSISATDKGNVTIGSNCTFGDNIQISAKGGSVIIGESVHIGTGTILVSIDEITIGTNTLIAEYVVIRDQDHETHTRPIRLAGFLKAPISIGTDVWIGCKASILRGGSVGDRSIIGAHSLVRSEIMSDSLAVGTPARTINRSESQV